VAGEVGRLLVTAELLRHGFGVARPECDDGFDLISVKRASTRRIQVKTVSTTQGKKPRPSEEFAIRRLRCRKGREKKTEDKCKYTADEIDAFVFVSLVTSNFWVVPIAEINLHGHSLSMRPENRWHEAWHLLEEDSDAA
jgi:hypothetical protein